MRSYTFLLSPLAVIVPVLCLCLIGSSATADPPLEDWCCEWQVGDVNLSGAIDITDLSVLIDNLFLTLTPLQCWGEADVNLDYTVDIADLQAFLVFIAFCDFGNGPGGSCFDYCPPPPVYGTMLPLTGCKTQKAVEGESCIIWEYDGQGLLSIQHVNACLNCCPENSATVTVSGGEITLDETTVNGLCDCICLFDIDFVVENLQPGEYTIAVDEHIGQIWPESFEFTVDLNATPTGMVCLERNLDPYGEI